MTLQTTNRLAKVAGPAAEIAATVIAMNIDPGQLRATWPAPNHPNRADWKAVITPAISIPAKTLQATKPSSSPEERIATAT